MKTRSLFRRIALILMAAMVMVTLTSCGGDGQASGYNIMVASGYVDGEALESFGETLKQEIPELASEEVNVSFSSTILGSADTDPMMNMGALVGFDAKVAAGEITVAIFDKESAAREARGGIFRPISEILTEEDMEKLEGKLIDYETVDEQGNPDGGRTEIVGVDISDNEALTPVMGAGEKGIFVVAGQEHDELTRELILHLAGIDSQK